MRARARTVSRAILLADLAVTWLAAGVAVVLTAERGA